MGISEVTTEQKIAALDAIYTRAKAELSKETWIQEDWEPLAKCTDRERPAFIALCAVLPAAFAQVKSLGAMALSFEKTHPARHLIMSEEQEDPAFYTKRLRPELLKNDPCLFLEPEETAIQQDARESY